MVVVRPGRVLFAKNSDRDANEGQNLEWHGRRTNAAGARVRCTYIDIPDVPETHAVLLSAPFWIWGAEMGTNEHGVTIGNEAVFTKAPYEKTPGLIGMDLLRLALERADTAKAACEVITSLLEQYGQGGGCGHESKKFVYHNSFIVADTKTAFVLETAGRKWAIEEVQGARSISNGLTIPEFNDRYSDFIKTTACGCRARQPRTQRLCEGASSIGDMIRILQDHGDGREHPHYAWANGGLNAPCVHGGGVLASSQTTGSWVAELTPDACRHWATGTAAPCISLFKPVSADAPVDVGPRAEDVANDSLWWQHEILHRRAMRNPAHYRAFFVEDRDETQARWIASPPSSRAAFDEGLEKLARWNAEITEQDARFRPPDQRPVWVRRYWAKRDRVARLDEWHGAQSTATV